MKYLSFFEVFNQDKVGHLSFAGHELWPSQKHQIIINYFKADVLKCLRISIQGGSSTRIYIPGHITRDMNFIRVPLHCCFVQINKIISIRTWDKNKPDTTTIDLTTLDKDLRSHKNQILVVTGCKELDYIAALVNYLNDKICIEGNIDDIDLTKLTSNTFALISRQQVIDAINNLTFECFENSFNRVGKDNFFWLEYEVRNLPNDSYLRKVFAEVLSKNCFRSSSSLDYIKITEESESAYLPAYPRRKIEGECNGQKYKDILHYEVASCLSTYGMISSRLAIE